MVDSYSTEINVRLSSIDSDSVTARTTVRHTERYCWLLYSMAAWLQ